MKFKYHAPDSELNIYCLTNEANEIKQTHFEIENVSSSLRNCSSDIWIRRYIPIFTAISFKLFLYMYSATSFDENLMANRYGKSGLVIRNAYNFVIIFDERDSKYFNVFMIYV